MTGMLLGEVFDIPARIAASDFVLQLHSGVEHASKTVSEYVVTDSLTQAYEQAFGYLDLALETGIDRGVFIHGTFGSGKSHFMAVLDLLLRGDPAARALPGLQQVLATNDRVLGANLLTVDYHLIGAESLEDALFSGYLSRIAQLHPDADTPLLHRSEALFADAASRRALDEAAFFETLNAGSGASGWGAFSSAWTPTTYDAAVAAGVDSAERQRLATDLIKTMFSGYVMAGQWLDISDGLGVMCEHARSLGYDGLVLFLDELVLWLASRLGDQDFVSSEGAKVAKLVETGIGERAIPLVSFVARQRELQDFLGDMAGAGVGGADRMAVGQSFKYWEERFDRISLATSNLPDIAHRRLLQPRDEAGRAAVAQALATLKSNPRSWDALLRDQIGSDEQAFAKVYPFSPALVEVLIHLSGLLQRERTALKVMAHLLSTGRDQWTIEQIIPVAALYDAMIGDAEQPRAEEIREQFDLARRLYERDVRPLLMDQHRITSTDRLPTNHAFFVDDRLAKTLIVSALAPVPALKDLTASRLAALNHGSVRAFIPGDEGTVVLTKVRSWAEAIGDLRIGDGPDPVISLTLSGVDYRSVLDRVATEDKPGERRSLIRQMVFEQFKISDSQTLFGVVQDYHFVWRGSKRMAHLVFGNIRDENQLPEQTLRAEGDIWRLIVDYPFDEGGHVPSDDVVRFDRLRNEGVVSRTVGWVPRFLNAARQEDVGTLVLLEFLLGGNGDHFDHHAQHLSPDQRPLAKSALINLRHALRDKLGEALKQAYGVAAPTENDIELAHAPVQTFPTLDASAEIGNPVGATLGQALNHVLDQMLSSQYPEHPKFEGEVKAGDLAVVFAHVRRAVAEGGRVEPVETRLRPTLRRIANALQCGRMYENHYVFDGETFIWRNRFVSWAAQEDIDSAVPVARMRAWLAEYGMTREVQNLLIVSWALMDDKQFTRHSGQVRVLTLAQVTDDLVLGDPQLPDEGLWESAVMVGKALFGVSVPQLRSASNVAELAERVGGKAKESVGSCQLLVTRLQEHAEVLGLDADSPRMRAALTAREFLVGLAAEDTELGRIGALGAFDLPTEPQALARSITSAPTVVECLDNADWTVLQALVGDPEADEFFSELRKVAAAQELHAPLETGLGAARTRATTLLAGRASRPPVPAKPTHVNEVQLDGVDLSVLEAQIRQAIAARPNATVKIRWWLE